MACLESKGDSIMILIRTKRERECGRNFVFGIRDGKIMFSFIIFGGGVKEKVIYIVNIHSYGRDLWRSNVSTVAGLFLWDTDG